MCEDSPYTRAFRRWIPRFWHTSRRRVGAVKRPPERPSSAGADGIWRRERMQYEIRAVLRSLSTKQFSSSVSVDIEQECSRGAAVYLARRDSLSSRLTRLVYNAIFPIPAGILRSSFAGRECRVWLRVGRRSFLLLLALWRRRWGRCVGLVVLSTLLLLELWVWWFCCTLEETGVFIFSGNVRAEKWCSTGLERYGVLCRVLVFRSSDIGPIRNCSATLNVV